MKVLHCPDLVGGHAVQLARAERKIGLDSKLIVFRQNYFNYPADEVLLTEGSGVVRGELARWRLLWRALRYDVIHYNFGQTIMPSRMALYSNRAKAFPVWLRLIYQLYVRVFENFDLKILKWLGKVIVVTFQGDDARQGDYCREHFAITFAKEVDDDYYTNISDQIKRERIGAFDKYADRIYALNPDLLHVLPRRAVFLPYASVDLESWKPVSTDNCRPLVLHAPSHRQVKGTRYIEAAVRRLKDEGLNFDFVLVEGMSNDEARSYYEKADILIDQLLAGWYGGLALEFMALGKPVIAYIRQSDLKFIPETMRGDLPVIQAEPNTIYLVLKRCLMEKKERLALIGRKSRSFAERWHDPIFIADKMKREYMASKNIEGSRQV